VNFSEKHVLDIGGNTGFFTFEAIKEGAAHVDYFEGNHTHADFVQVAAKVLNVYEKVSIHPEYYLFEKQPEKYDIILNLNVIHHFADDFKAGKGKKEAKMEMILCINTLAEEADFLIFQMRFN
jgi:2-polyprenyl-3-methyl-5-hydroxy-6-metoxy-1,4-benzoquinol methylase